MAERHEPRAAGHRSERAVDRLKVLAEASRAFAEVVPDYETLLEVVAERVSEATGDACTVRLLSKGDRWLRPVAGHHPDPELKAAIWEVMSVTAQRSDAGMWKPVIEEGRTVRLTVSPQEIPPDASDLQADFVRRHPMTSIMGAPMVVRGRIIGGLSLVRYGGVNPHAPEDETFLRDLAERAALAIDNARLYRAAQDEIAERERIEANLRSSEKRFRATFEQAAVGIAHVAPDGSWIRVNDKLCEITGYPREELLEKTFQDITHPDDLDADLEQAQQLLSGEIETYSMEKRYIKKDGSIVWINLTGSLVREPSGKPAYFIAVVEDISERKKGEEQLVYHARLLENMHDAVIATDERFTLTAWNRGAEATYGWEAGEVLGRDVREVVRSEFTAQQRAEALQRLSETGRYRVEVVSYRRDGTPIYVEGITITLTDDRGKLTGYLSINRDITERKRAEREIEERAHQQAIVAELGRRALAKTDLQALLDEAASLVVKTLDVEYSKVVERLPEGLDLLLRAGAGGREGFVGGAKEEPGLGSLAGYTLLSDETVVVDDLHAETRFTPPPLLFEQGVVSSVSVVIEGREEPFGVLEAHSVEPSAFSENDVNFLRAVANVIAAAAQRQQDEETLRKVKQAERDRMARDLHDEVLQDLTYALAAMQAAREMPKNTDSDDQLEGAVHALKRAGQGLRGAIYDLRLEGTTKEDLVELLGSLVELNRSRWPESSIVLSVKANPAPVLPELTETELVRMVGEALTNARRHSGARNVRLALEADEDMLRIEIQDDGRGFDPATANGSGLKGMHERAHALGGTLWVESEPGTGTRIRFELDLEREHPEEAQEAWRVLLVEDHASFREAVVSMLERDREFSIVAQAGSLAEAREMLDGVDVVIVDLELPDGFGGNLIKDLHSKNPQAQALVLSASLDRAEVAQAVESGAAGVLHKSVGMEEVLQALRRLRRGETLMPLEEVVELLRFASARKDREYEARQAIARLTPRERAVLEALAEGLDSKEIAERLHISVKTEANHMTSILSKLGVHSRLQALVFAARHGVVEIN